MPSADDNVQYLYLVLTEGGQPDVDWVKVAEELGLNKAAATKRWSRLKAAMANSTSPGPTAYQLLWLCMKHNTREKVPDWNEVAQKCNMTPGAASKRYYRMKQAFENGTAGPAPTPAPKGSGGEGKSGTATKRKRTDGGTKAKADNAQEQAEPKRARPSKKNPVKVKPENTQDEEDASVIPKDSLLGELEAAVKKAGGKVDEDDEDNEEFYDAEETQAQERVKEWLAAGEAAEEAIEEV